VACILALAFGASRLGTPSLWHDELVHVYVAKSLAEGNAPKTPGGQIYMSGTATHVAIAAFIKFFGDSEAAVRAPSVVCGVLNVWLLFLILRPHIGRVPAMVAAFSLALSPWSVAWSREANIYALQQTAYLSFALAITRFEAGVENRRVIWPSIALVAAYLIGVFSSFTSILFPVALGAYAAIRWLASPRLKSPWFAAGIACVLTVGITYAIYHTSFSALDKQVLTETSAVGGDLPDPKLNRDHSDRFYYFRFLMNNLSSGYFLLALIGFVLILFAEGKRSALPIIAFWAPLLVLTYLIGYRMHRFMFFAYPFYVAAHAYGTVALLRFIATSRTSPVRGMAAAVVTMFMCMIGVSTARLIGDTLDAASGASTTLARRHPEWREPCAFVRARIRKNEAVVATTYLPALYYVGRCDEWYPSRYTWYEKDESGTEGLKDLAAFQDYMNKNPSGVLIAERARFERWQAGYLKEDVEWAKAHLRRIPQGSNQDITLFAWGDAIRDR
jgi:4-amino-4-deoxy-L-arabinose transferase-like glycosyltransferase